MDTLYNDSLCVRDFASHVVEVQPLLEWMKKIGAVPPTIPDVLNYRFVQVESLLCAIERGAIEGLTDASAAPIAATLEMPPDDPSLFHEASRWQVGADAHLQWRLRLRDAFSRNELRLLHYGSKLPVTAVEPATPERNDVDRPALRGEQDKEAMRKMRANGLSDKKIGERYGISRQRVGQLLGPRSPASDPGPWRGLK